MATLKYMKSILSDREIRKYSKKFEDATIEIFEDGYIEGLRQIWHTSKETPDKGKVCICVSPQGEGNIIINLCEHNGETFCALGKITDAGYITGCEIDNVTEWMYLPDIPKR